MLSAPEARFKPGVVGEQGDDGVRVAALDRGGENGPRARARAWNAAEMGLLAHRLRTGRSSGLVFGQTGETPFNYDTASRRAQAAWRRAKLEPIGLHECRHTFASLMITAGVNAKALSAYMGHSSVTITYDRYGHLLPGNEEQAAVLLDDYLARATGAQTGAQSR